MLSGNDIRKKYLEFFAKKQHKVYESASLIPDDPTMLLTIAGMVPFKPFFMGKAEPPYKRLASSQKCIRTNDLENVGRTARHHTLFEMLGNFSFGDYFKEEAIEFAWEFVTTELSLDKDKLWVSVFENDDESVEIWNKKMGMPLERIVKLGEKDNFWKAGPTGSCGPCSEIYVDRGEEYGCGSSTCGVGCDCDRYLEIWNLVFTEFNRLEDGSLEPLPKKNIDTGMGLERITSVIQNVSSNFETDLLFPILKAAADKTGKKYGESEKVDFSLRVITDHIRAVTFLICDGVLPSNDGRGYVLRRILRRAIRHGRLLGYNSMFLYELTSKVIEIMGDAYPDLKEKESHIKKVILKEEEKFQHTLDQGIIIATESIEKAKAEGKTSLNADDVFKLYDTYGFPYELTEEICQENGINIDFEEFKVKMEEQKERAREAREVIKEKIEDSFIDEFYTKYGKTNFTGYSSFNGNGKALYVNNIDSSNVEVIFDSTPFYAESGGQAADYGIVESISFKGRVYAVTKRRDIFIHRIEVVEGDIELGETYSLVLDISRRENIKRNHTATHLLQAALRAVIGTHVQQAGSMVDGERARFDFTHYEGLKVSEISAIEDMVNNKILENIKVDINNMSQEEAKAKGAMALFGDKYGDVVRVVEVKGFSTELCGGTHVTSTGEIGLFKILSEAGVAAGTRRIEAVTGLNTLNYINGLNEKIAKSSVYLKSDSDHIVERAQKVMEELKDAQKEIEVLKSKIASNESSQLTNDIKEINGVKVLIKGFNGKNAEELREMVDKLKDKMISGVVVLASNNGNAVFAVGVTKDVVSKVKAGDIVKEMAKIADGNGGGRPDFAQAGGKDGTKVDEALKFAEELLRGKI